MVSMLNGRLREWWINLGEYRQLQVLQCGSIDAFMDFIHTEFIGSPLHHTDQAREEFLKMKCCSFKRHDLEKHYDRMSKRFYTIAGINDVNLKQAFLNSIPGPLGDETIKIMETKKIPLQSASIGEIFQHVLLALEKLCNQT